MSIPRGVPTLLNRLVAALAMTCLIWLATPPAHAQQKQQNEPAQERGRKKRRHGACAHFRRACLARRTSLLTQYSR